MNVRKYGVNTLKKASKHIYYEVAAFYHALGVLKKCPDQLCVNTNLDNYVVHLRNIFNFLYPRSITKKHKKHYKDDILAIDFVQKRGEFKIAKTKKRDIKYIIYKADKQVCHLTYSRNRFAGIKKGWDFDIIGLMIYKSLNAFLGSLPENYKEWEYFIELKKTIDNYIKQ